MTSRKNIWAVPFMIGLALLLNTSLAGAFTFTFNAGGGIDSVNIKSGDVGDSFTANYSFSDPALMGITLEGYATFTVDALNYTTDKLNLTVTLDNTTDISSDPGGRYDWTNLTWNVDPESMVTNFTADTDGTLDDSFNDYTENVQPSGGLGVVDVCVHAASCAGAGNTGLGPNDGTDQFQIQLMAGVGEEYTEENGVTLSTFLIKFQTDRGSYEFTPVPEPTSLVLSALGLVAVGGYALRRQRKAKV